MNITDIENVSFVIYKTIESKRNRQFRCLLNILKAHHHNVGDKAVNEHGRTDGTFCTDGGTE